MKYDYKAVEAKWQKVWEDEKTFHAEIDHTKPKFYALVEFPYPSGAGLHVGHPRSYTALDVVSRKRRQNGYNVLYPMARQLSVVISGAQQMEKTAWFLRVMAECIQAWC